MKYWMICLTAVAVLFGAVSCGPKKTVKGEGPAYMIDLYQGTVQVSRDGGKNWIQAEPEMKLSENDWIKTGPGSFCDLILPDRGICRVSENTLLTIATLKPKSEKFSVQRGKVVLNITKKLESDESFEVETAAAVLAVRGTQFLVDSDGEKVSAQVKEGTVAVRRKMNLTVPAGMNAEEVAKALEISVTRDQEVETSVAENRAAETELNQKLAGARSADEVRSVLAAVKKGQQARVKKVSNNARFNRDFEDVNAPGLLKKVDLRQDEEALETNVNALRERTGQTGMAERKTGGESTTAQEDIESGEADKKAREVQQRTGQSGIANKAVNPDDTETDDEALDRMKQRARQRMSK